MLEVQPTVVSLSDAAAAKLHELTKEEANPAIGLRVKYTSLEGWTSYSPEFALDFAKQPDVRYRR